MFERTVSSNSEKAYEELRKVLLRNKCKIVAEENPNFISVEQGSFWGVTPTGVKKKISFHFFPQESGTRILSNSSLAPDWVYSCVVSYVLLGVFALIFWWGIVDLEASIIAQRWSLWGGLAEFLGYTGFQQAWNVVNLLKIMVISLAVVIVIGVVADIYIYTRKDSFSETLLKFIP